MLTLLFIYSANCLLIQVSSYTTFLRTNCCTYPAPTEMLLLQMESNTKRLHLLQPSRSLLLLYILLFLCFWKIIIFFFDFWIELLPGTKEAWPEEREEGKCLSVHNNKTRWKACFDSLFLSFPVDRMCVYFLFLSSFMDFVSGFWVVLNEFIHQLN
jgi:hypothetical protein